MSLYKVIFYYLQLSWLNIVRLVKRIKKIDENWELPTAQVMKYFKNGNYKHSVF